MKVISKDGTEVEIDDSSAIAVAAQELEKAKGLGFDSIGALVSQKEADNSALVKRVEDGQSFIDKQKNELGDLRKLTATSPAPKEAPEAKAEETPDDREDRYRKQNASTRGTLTDAEREHAEKEFLKQYEESSPDERILLKTHEGRSAFMSAVFPKKQTEDASPVGLFEAPVAPKLSIGEQVMQAIRKDDEGRSRRPVIPQISGSGYNPVNAKPVSKPVPMALARGGGIIDAMKTIDNRGD